MINFSLRYLTKEISMRWYVISALVCFLFSTAWSEDSPPDTSAKVVQLPEVTITSAPVARELPVSSVVVSPVAIQRTVATDSWDLLRQTTGIEVHEQGQGPGFASDASIRGFSSDHSTDLALWIDGVPVNEPINGHAEGYNDFSLLMPEAIHSLNLIKGPTSALYGNFSMAGVVNVRTLERMDGTDIRVSGGTFGKLEGSALSGFDNGSSSGVFGIRGIQNQGWRPNSQYDLEQAHARYLQNVFSDATIDAGVELYSANWHSPGSLTAAQFAQRQYNVVANSTDGGYKRRAQERVSLRFSPDSIMFWRTTIFATQGRWQLFLTTPPEGGLTEGSGNQTEEEDKRYGLGGTSALTWQFPQSEITVGVEGKLDHSNYENWFTTNRERDSAQILVSARQSAGAFFFQSEENVGDAKFTLGGRYDILSVESVPEGGGTLNNAKGIFSPKLGVMYSFPENFSVYANISRGFRSTDGTIEDPSLPFITAWAYETGTKFDADVASGSVALFRMNVSNEQTFDPVTLTSTNGGKSRRQGVEVSAMIRFTNQVRFITDVTFNDARYENLITEGGDTLSGARVYNTAKCVGDAALDVVPNAQWQFRLNSDIVGPYSPFDEPGVVLPPYVIFSMTIGTHIGDAFLQLGIKNLADKAYPELRAGGFVNPGQPRTLYGTASYSF
ncbi:MAG: TonB-dependent receptor [Bacteroidota bacterium]|nr:TonB-dependent receptor [Bacteroidota bacterium]